MATRVSALRPVWGLQDSDAVKSVTLFLQPIELTQRFGQAERSAAATTVFLCTSKPAQCVKTTSMSSSLRKISLVAKTSLGLFPSLLTIIRDRYIMKQTIIVCFII